MLFTDEEREQLLENGRQAHDTPGVIDHKPVVKLFTPDGNCTWLLSRLYPADNTIAFGLCDLGMGFPELGDVSIAEITAVRGTAGLPVEKDLHFKADKLVSEYATIAHQHQRIVT